MNDDLSNELKTIRQGFSVAVSLLIVYLAIFRLDYKLTILWLLAIPTIFATIYIYDMFRQTEPMGLRTILLFSLGGPVSFLGFVISFLLIMKDIRDEKYEEPISKKGDGDTRYDEHTEVRREQEDQE